MRSRPETALERALVARLASLLWRLRRAVAIESGLFEIQGRIVRDRQRADAMHADDPLKVFYDLLTSVSNIDESEPLPRANLRDLSVSFLRLENHSSGMLDLVGRYETRLWRQLAQTIFMLESTPRRPTRYRTPIRPDHFLAWR